MQYKMIVSDFDGTLLRSDNTVSRAVAEAIARFRAAGGVFTVSTGRSYRSILNRLPETGLTGSIPVMALQGAYAADSQTCEKLFSTPLGFDALERFAAAADREGLYYHVYTEQEIFTARHCEISALYEKLTGTEVREVGDPVAFLRGRSDVIKVLSVSEAAITRDLCAGFQKEMPDLQIFTSSPIFIECVSSKAGKGNGVRRVARTLGLTMEEVAAIGDEMNDYTMVEAAGLGAAVGNAVPALKEAADLVVSANDADGVLELIEYCLDS